MEENELVSIKSLIKRISIIGCISFFRLQRIFRHKYGNCCFHFDKTSIIPFSLHILENSYSYYSHINGCTEIDLSNNKMLEYFEISAFVIEGRIPKFINVPVHFYMS